jgi:hypothetical protein
MRGSRALFLSVVLPAVFLCVLMVPAESRAAITRVTYTSGANTWTVPTLPYGITTVQYLLVGGGGGGGAAVDRTGGGGGAGGVLAGALAVSSGQQVSAIVGGGGGPGAQGGNTVLGSVTAYGGGRGGRGQQPCTTLGACATTGGSGGGGYHNPTDSGKAGTAGQGNAGGNGYDSGVVGQPFAAGGGGGAGGAGASGNTTSGGNGGPGVSSSMSGAAVTYGGGGGGGGENRPGGLGGSGGGGRGNSVAGGAGTAGTANTGGGGGGGGTNGAGGAGGSGIIIIAVPVAPVLSGGSPSGALPYTTTQTTLSVTTNEASTCRLSTTAGVAYPSMGTTFTTTGGTSHSIVVSGLTQNSSHTRYVRCQEANGYSNPSDYTVSWSVAPDTVAPVASGGSPSGQLMYQTAQTVVSVTTDEAATCKISSVAGVAYASMGSTFTTTGGTSHQITITGLISGNTYNRYVRCIDIYNNIATSDYTVSWSVSGTPPAGPNPSVSVSQPAAGSTQQGTISVGAEAYDDVGVVGVQFKVDGVNIEAEDTAPPYLISWNTNAVANGARTITAVARDGSGNQTTSAGVGITINNATIPVITSTGSALGTVGTAFSYQITANYVPTSYSATGLPPGLSVNTSNGLISGTPSAGSAGDYAVTLRATNSAGTGTKTLNITISATGVSTPITGWAWSDMVGWVSMSGTGYGLTIGAGGTLSGYAWNDKVGWITADTACGTPQATLSGSSFTGWLHALYSGTDGCISLTSANGGTGYGLTYTAGTGVIGGYAWGSEPIGWMLFDALATVSPATCVISAAPAQLYSAVYPPSITLSYTTSNASSAAIDGVSVPTSGTSYSAQNGTPLAWAPPSVTYTMTVTNPSGAPSTCNTTVNVNNGYPPPVGCISLGAANPTCSAPVVKAKNIRKGDSVGVFWSVANANASSCSITKNGGAWLAGQATSTLAGVSSGALTERTEYLLSCQAQDGTTFTDTGVVNIIPEFQEI